MDRNELTQKIRQRMAAGLLPRAVAPLTAPGRPGSITEGPEEQRGYQLELDTPPMTRIAIRVELKTPK